jgi:carboxypeptidase-like protein
MLRSVQIQIPKPCHENWNNMAPDEQGRFCGSCQKIVVDFTAMSDKELLDHISTTAGQHACGRFSTHQLNTDLTKTESKRQFSWAYVWNVLLASLLATESYAQGELQIKKKQEMYLPDVAPTPGPFEVRERDSVPEKIVQGIILQSKTNKPLQYAYVTIKGTSKGVVCNDKGEFRIAVEDKDSVMLQCSSIGFKTQTLAINKNSNVHVSVLMEEDTTELTGDFIVTAYHYTFKQKVKRFFRRTFIAPFKRL